MHVHFVLSQAEYHYEVGALIIKIRAPAFGCDGFRLFGVVP